MKKFLDTSDLITYTSGKYKGKYDWLNNIGKELYFEYDGLTGYLKILNYEKAIPQGKITIQYKNNIMTTTTPNLLHLKIPSLFNMEKQSNTYKYSVGQIIHKYNDTLEIIKQIRIEYNKSYCRGYVIKCLDCGYEYNTREDKLSTCPICGKRSSYAERYTYSILKQAKIKFIPQKEFEWLHNKFYDIYLPDYNVLIEINGQQHYEPIKFNNHESANETYIRNIHIDKLKSESASNNGLLLYSVNASNIKNIFNEIIKTINFIDFSNVSILECEKFADYKRIKDACKLWNLGYEINDIKNQTGKSLQTIGCYLRLGEKFEMLTRKRK